MATATSQCGYRTHQGIGMIYILLILFGMLFWMMLGIGFLAAEDDKKFSLFYWAVSRGILGVLLFWPIYLSLWKRSNGDHRRA